MAQEELYCAVPLKTRYMTHTINSVPLVKGQGLSNFLLNNKKNILKCWLKEVPNQKYNSSDHVFQPNVHKHLDNLTPQSSFQLKLIDKLGEILSLSYVQSVENRANDEMVEPEMPTTTNKVERCRSNKLSVPYPEGLQSRVESLLSESKIATPCQISPSVFAAKISNNLNQMIEASVSKRVKRELEKEKLANKQNINMGSVKSKLKNENRNKVARGDSERERNKDVWCKKSSGQIESEDTTEKGNLGLSGKYQCTLKERSLKDERKRVASSLESDCVKTRKDQSETKVKEKRKKDKKKHKSSSKELDYKTNNSRQSSKLKDKVSETKKHLDSSKNHQKIESHRESSKELGKRRKSSQEPVGMQFSKEYIMNSKEKEEYAHRMIFKDSQAKRKCSCDELENSNTSADINKIQKHSVTLQNSENKSEGAQVTKRLRSESRVNISENRRENDAQNIRLDGSLVLSNNNHSIKFAELSILDDQGDIGKSFSSNTDDNQRNCFLNDTHTMPVKTQSDFIKIEPEDTVCIKTELEDTVCIKTEPEDTVCIKTEPEDVTQSFTDYTDCIPKYEVATKSVDETVDKYKKKNILVQYTNEWLNHMGQNTESNNPFKDLCAMMQTMGLQIWKDSNYPEMYAWEVNFRRIFVLLYTELDLDHFTKHIHESMLTDPNLNEFIKKYKKILKD